MAKNKEQTVKSGDIQKEIGMIIDSQLGKLDLAFNGILNNALSIQQLPKDPFQRNEDGSVNWRAMLHSDELYPNRDWFDRNKKEVPTSLEGLEDRQLLILLGGIKRLAKLRGYSRQSLDVVECGPSRVVVKCSIDWAPFEGEGEIHTESIANATSDNCDDFTIRFLETIAENRAFVRCVRNFLGINIVGADEIDKNKGERKSESAAERKPMDLSDMKPQGQLSKLFGGDFEAFKGWLRELWTNNAFRDPSAASWSSFSDVPASESVKLIGLKRGS